jgi:hypothetical protein
MQRIVEIGMEVEQQIDAALLCGADIAKRLGRIGEAALRLGIELDAPQPLGHRPAKGRLGQTHGKPGEELDDTRLLDRLDEHDRGVRAQQNLQVVQVRHHRVHGLLGIHGASSRRVPAGRGRNLRYGPPAPPPAAYTGTDAGHKLPNPPASARSPRRSIAKAPLARRSPTIAIRRPGPFLPDSRATQRPPMTAKDHLIIFDTTLRDGEQSPGASMTRDEKVRIAKALERMRVDVIEAGFPIASPGDFEAVKAVAETVKESRVCGLARALDKDIDRAGEALAGATPGGSIPSSPPLPFTCSAS